MDRAARLVAAALLLVEGGVHLREWEQGLREIPTIGPLFLVNVAASVLIALWLALRSDHLAVLAGIGLSFGTFVGFLITRYGSLFQYSETRWRPSAVLAAVVEVAAGLILCAVAARRLRERTA